MVVFECDRCGALIFDATETEPVPTICMGCQLLETIDDPAERETMRQRLGIPAWH